MSNEEAEQSADAAEAVEPAVQETPEVVSEDAAPTSPLSAAIAALQEEKQQTWDRLLRTAAELENFKKRSKRDVGEARRRAEDRVVLEFLPIIDNLERALAHIGEEVQDGGLVDGVKMVHKQFLTALEKFDIRPFDAVDQPFDPEYHEAIQQMASDKPPGTVVHELQRGYRRGDRLVRPALVVVSGGQPAASTTPEGAAETEGETTTEDPGSPEGPAEGADGDGLEGRGGGSET